MAEIENVDIFGGQEEEDLDQLKQKVNDLENIISGLNPRNLAGLSKTSILNAITQFGGDGTDGHLNIVSGTTTLDLANADYYERNYKSISITGTGKLAFSNPGTNGTIIVLKSQGDVILTSSTAPMIDCSSLGGAGGASVNGNLASGNTGSLGNSMLIQSDFGDGGNPASGDTGGSASSASSATAYLLSIIGKVPRLSCGAGGGSGGMCASGQGGASGAGGRGGGGLLIECKGDLNFTTASGISVAGANGSNATAATQDRPGAGGGGGGAGGVCAIVYNGLIANTGTITVTGGNGGNGANGVQTVANGGGGGGGAGGANRYAGGAGGAGGTTSGGTPAAGSNGSNGSGTGGGTGGTGGSASAANSGGGGGGGGSAGDSYVVQNTEFI